MLENKKYWMYFLSIYENKTIKPVKIIPRRCEAGRRMREGVNFAKIYCQHICKYHNVFLCTTIIC
jgi:hypothetical protein